MIDNIRTSGEWKIPLPIKMKFMLIKDDSDGQLLHSKSNSKEIIIGVGTDELLNNFSLCFWIGIKRVWNNR